MILSEAISKINYELRALDDDAPVVGNEEHTYWVSLLNNKKNMLYEDVTKKWSSSFKATAPAEVGTVATTGTTTLTGTGTFFTDYNVGDKITVSGETERTIASISSDTSLTVTSAFSNTASSKTFTRKIIIDDGILDYNLHRSFIGPSDRVYVLTTSGEKIFLSLEHPEERDYVSQAVQINGQNPQILSFNEAIASDSNFVGGTLIIPGYYMPDDIDATDEDAILPFPDPYWAVAAVAYEIAFNDITYEDKAADLNAKANNLYNMMLRKNMRGTYAKSRKVPTRVKRIGVVRY